MSLAANAGHPTGSRETFQKTNSQTVLKALNCETGGIREQGELGGLEVQGCRHWSHETCGQACVCFSRHPVRDRCSRETEPHHLGGATIL